MRDALRLLSRQCRSWEGRLAGFVLAVACQCVVQSGVSAATPLTARSPNGRNEIQLQVVDGKLAYEVRRDGEPIIEPSLIDPVISPNGGLGSGTELVEAQRGAIDQESPLSWDRSKTLHDHCTYVVANCQNAASATWQVELRAYDDGVAFRYRIPRQPEAKQIELLREQTEFNVAGAPNALCNTLDGFRTSHESLYEFQPLSQVPTGRLIDCPMLLVWPSGQAAAITEARVRHFAGMYLDCPASDKSLLRSRLSPSFHRDDAAVITDETLESPWRVILLADTAGALLESNLLLCLNDPPQGDFAWARPGKTTFDWWAGEFELDYQLPHVTETFVNRHKKYIDFCAQHGIAYHMLAGDGRPWYPQTSTNYAAPSPDADVRKQRPELDLPAIFAYARERGVGIRLWVHWQPLSTHLEEAFTLYEQWGVAGLMVDFLDRDDQEMIEFTERLLESAARHKLNIQVHGSSKFSGEQRTFPNLFNREGVLNLEYLKWGALCTPDHNVNVAYTRGLAGPVDYHLGGFRSVSRAAFKPELLSPVVLGTRCHHMALYLVYENPMPMLADRPDHYEGQPGFDFLCKMPSTWDETRFVAGEPGQYVVLARRSGKSWFLGGITNWTPRTLDVPLTFLGEGEFTLSLNADGSMDEEQPNKITESQQSATATTTLKVSLAPGGGFIGRLAPQ